MADEKDKDTPVDLEVVSDAYDAIEGVVETQRQIAAVTAAGAPPALDDPSLRTPAFDFAAVSAVLNTYSQTAKSLASAEQFVADTASTINRSLVHIQRAAVQVGATASGLAKVEPQLTRWLSTPIIQPPKQDLLNWLANVSLSAEDLAPRNLAEFFDDLEKVAKLSSEEGLPLSWIPRKDIVGELLATASSDERRKVLSGRTSDILDDCTQLLVELPGLWAKEALIAVNALRAGFHGPAQSHAANVFDSIILYFFAVDNPRNMSGARRSATQEGSGEFGDTPFDMVCEALTLRPVTLAYTSWYPGGATPPPSHFARHVTAHGVGYPGVFSPHAAITSVMLATSLCAQYARQRTDTPQAGASPQTRQGEDAPLQERSGAST